MSSIEQTIEGKKVFNNIEVPAAVRDTQATNKKYVDYQVSGLRTEQSNYVKKSGDTCNDRTINYTKSFISGSRRS